MIAVTQPRKVAATSLAYRVATEQNGSVGDLVGYAVRFDEKSSHKTRIKYLTDGMIVRELMSDPLLTKYSVVIVDEAHERTLRTDLLIANLKTIQRQRNGGGDGGASIKGKGNADPQNPLKIVIMSATLDAEKFSKFYHEYVLSSFLVFGWKLMREFEVLKFFTSKADNIKSKYIILPIANWIMLRQPCGRFFKYILISLRVMF